MNKLLDFFIRAEHKVYITIKRMRLKNKTMTVFANNCNAGFILHDLGLPFNTPTINTGFYPEQYFKFLSDPQKYLSSEIEETHLMDGPFWVGKLNDITMRIGHYRSFEEAQEAWKRRSKRVNLDNVYILMTDKDGCTYEHIKQFDELPYKNKVIFTHKEYKEFASAYYIPGFEDKDEVGVLSDWKPQLLRRRWLDDFDYVSFFNQNKDH